MATLTIHFESNDSTTVMHSMGSRDFPSSLLTVRRAQIIHRGRGAERANASSVVYKGELTVDDSEEVVEVAVKLLACDKLEDLEDLEYEHSLYSGKVKELQGEIVPMCYGLFQVPNKLLACIVLQYCGEPVLCEFDELDMDLRLDVLECLMAIHDVGVEHRDFVPQHVLLKDGHKPFIVDFQSSIEHECQRTTDIVEGALAPNEFHFDCSEIYRYTFDNCIWRAGFFMVLGAAVPEKCATSYESVARAARARGLSRLASPESVDRDIRRALRLKKAIDENNGLRPRLGVLKAKGII